MASIVVLARDDQSSRVVVHALRQRFGDLTVIIEGPSPRRSFVSLRLPLLRHRLRRLGAAKVAGQLLFYVYGRVAEQRANRRKRAILAQYHLDDAPLRESEVHRVSSVNSADTIALLRTLGPDVVVVNGTGIISSEVLASVDAPFINTHTGITPLYRGVHGGYWALVNGDKENCGVTIHLVDAGIDTGGILYQSRIEPTQEDNYFTYPMLQYAAGVPLLLRAVSDALAGRLSAHREEGKRSALWTHPTLFEYLRNGWIRRVW